MCVHDILTILCRAIPFMTRKCLCYVAVHVLEMCSFACACMCVFHTFRVSCARSHILHSRPMLMKCTLTESLSTIDVRTSYVRLHVYRQICSFYSCHYFSVCLNVVDFFLKDTVRISRTVTNVFHSLFGYVYACRPIEDERDVSHTIVYCSQFTLIYHRHAIAFPQQPYKLLLIVYSMSEFHVYLLKRLDFNFSCKYFIKFSKCINFLTRIFFLNPMEYIEKKKGFFLQI